MSGNSFLKGAFVLTIAGILVKVLGSVSRIFISRILGGEGVGLYQMAYPIYLLIISISSAGIPIAISILVSERLAMGDLKGANKTFKLSLVLMLMTGLVFSVLLYFGAGFLIEKHIVRDERAYLPLISLAPAILFSTVLASLRGYFQGFQTMTPTAVSQICEQLVRVIGMVVLSYTLLVYGLEYGAAGAALASFPGAVVGILVLLYFYYKRQKVNSFVNELQINNNSPLSTWQLIKRLIQLAIPVSLASIIVPLVSTIDALLVPMRLEVAGFGVREATTLFGYLSGMAIPLVLLATMPTTSLALSIVPAVSEAYVLKDKIKLNSLINSGVRLASIVTIPCFFGLLVLAKPISQLLYATPEAGTCIAIMAGGIFFLGLHQVATAVLQGINKASIPMVTLIISACAKVILVWILTALPKWNIAGAAWAGVLDFALAAFLNLFFLYKITGFLINFLLLARIFAAGLSMAACAYMVYHLSLTYFFSSNLATIFSILVGGVVYLLMLFVLNGVKKAEVEKIPILGAKIETCLGRIRFLKE